MQRSNSCCLCLEAFSVQQKLRVSLCLHDNRQHHLVTMETPLPYQVRMHGVSPGQQDALHHKHLFLANFLFGTNAYFLPPPQAPDLPSDLGLLSLSQSHHPFPPSPPPPVSPPPPFTSMFPFSSSPPPPSSCSTLMSPVWKQREEERQQGEGESSSEASESVGGFRSRGLHLFHLMDEDQEEEESGCRPPGQFCWFWVTEIQFLVLDASFLSPVIMRCREGVWVRCDWSVRYRGNDGAPVCDWSAQHGFTRTFPSIVAGIGSKCSVWPLQAL